ncbi:MAG: PPOX class F420-dependent oxidoreductase [Proteobacteria bacterium]|nr:PPOX class F420-dependent oxidoreductase [Pseudomonadota bacterium]
MAAAEPFAAFDGQRYLNLETYRRDGRGVRTPLWFVAGPAAAGPVLYVYSLANSGKAKRLRRSAEARIAPCDARGRVTGDWVPVRATTVSGADHVLGMQLLDRKYWPWKTLLNATVLLFKRRERIVIAIRPVT